ncbi:cellulose binding domain-containing protein [Streptomyces sp. NPDC101165]
MSRNADVATGSSVSFGFTGSWSGPNTKTTSFELNGSFCKLS